MHLFIMMTIFHLSLGKFIQVHNINSENSAMKIKLGNGRLLTGYNRLLHTIDLQQVSQSITILQELANKLNESGDFSKIIDIKIRKLINEYKTILPQKSGIRNKRSIETLGSTIKFITGNLDANDLRIINQNIQAIKDNDYKLIKETNNQIIINQSFQNYINKLNEEVKKYENYIYKLTTQKNYVLNENSKIALIFQIEMLLNFFNIITNQINMNIVNHQLLTTKELKIIYDQLESTGLKPRSLDDVYNFIGVTRFYHGNHLVFSFDIPKVSSTTYEITRIEPLPSSGKIIDIGSHSKYLVSKTETLQVLLDNGINIFKRSDVLNITDSCITPLTQGLKGKCPFKETTLTPQIQLLTFGTLIVKSASNTTLSSTCGVNEKQLNGNYMIIFHNCSVIIQNQLFENEELQFDHPNILPIKSTQVEESHLEKIFNMTLLHEVQKVNQQHLESLKIYQHSSSGVILVIILVIIATITYTKWNAITIIFKKRTGRASTKGGGVKNEPALVTLSEVTTTSSASSSMPTTPNIHTSTLSALPTIVPIIPTCRRHQQA